MRHSPRRSPRLWTIVVAIVFTLETPNMCEAGENPQYTGPAETRADLAHDGQLPWVVGASSYQVVRSVASNPSATDGSNASFRHHHFLAWWDGRDGKLLNACNTYGTGNSKTVTATWQDSTSPAAAAAMLNCEGGGVNQPQTHIPNVVEKVANVQPDPQFIRDSLAQLGALCLKPLNTRPPGVTDVKLIRVIMKGGANTTVLRFKGGQP